jgi:hypothetical protein
MLSHYGFALFMADRTSRTFRAKIPDNGHQAVARSGFTRLDHGGLVAVDQHRQRLGAGGPV